MKPSATQMIARLGLPLLGVLALVLPFRPVPGKSEDTFETGPLRLQWTAEVPRPAPAWPDQPRIPIDLAPRPLFQGDRVFHGCTRTDSVVARDRDSGAILWRFETGGPVRLALAAWRDLVYAASDDGYLYAIDVASGKLVWKHRGGPSDRKLFGNERLISAWPARGGPVVATDDDDSTTVYFGAGIWPFMGIFLHALDARTGKVRWTCDGEGARYMKQPHNADAFAGVAPQGSLVVAGKYLLVPGGRSVPAAFDRATGEFVHFRLAENGKTGGALVQAADRLFVCGDSTFELATGISLKRQGEPNLLTSDRLYAWEKGQLAEFDTSAPIRREEGKEIPAKTKGPRVIWEPRRLGAIALPTAPLALTRQGDYLLIALPNRIVAHRLPLGSRDGQPVWEETIPGTPVTVTADAGAVLVTTRQGGLYCFGAQPRENPAINVPTIDPPVETPAAERARAIMEATGQRDGYALLYGDAASDLARELVRQSTLRVILAVSDAKQATEVRARAAREGVYADRLGVLVGTPESLELPPYFANLIVVDLPEPLEEAIRDRVTASLRPFGGVLVGALDRIEFTRAGPLVGAGNWTHEHGDAAGTRRSRDSIVKAPLGMLWFGGPSADNILPRHGHGPQPQVIDGRCIIEGMDLMRALDIYTGRLLWETKLPGVGKLYDNTAHQPGANASGGNYVSLSDTIYVAVGRECVRLDPATGREKGRFSVPKLPGVGATSPWSYVNVVGEYLIGGTLPDNPTKGSKLVAPSASKVLFVIHRQTGKFLWSAITRQDGWRHNAVCGGDGRLYAIERPTSPLLWGGKATDKPKGTPRLVTFDLATGKELWTTENQVFGTLLAYSTDHKILVECGRVARDGLPDEPTGMRAFDAVTGKILWHKEKYTGPMMLRGDQILSGAGDGRVYKLRTGEPVRIPDPLTGDEIDWTWTRAYGCNTPMASEHLVTFRSGAAGFYDLCNAGGTGNLGGFRSGCSNNLVVAGGVLMVPDYTRTCTCSYQNQCSVALIPMPDADLWTYRGGSKEVKGVVRRLGVLLGAPGNRKAESGTLWLEYPPSGSPGPRPEIVVSPATPAWFRRHTSSIQGDPAWVGASGAIGLDGLTVTLGPKGTPARLATLRLFFVEPEARAVGERVFSVTVNGKTLLPALDIQDEAKAPWKLVRKEFTGVVLTDKLELQLKASTDHPPVLSGIEIVPE